MIVLRSSATPRLYQEICERGLQSTNQDELIDDFVVVEPQVEDQGIVVKSYRPTQLIWSHLPQVGRLLPPTHLWVRQGGESVGAGRLVQRLDPLCHCNQSVDDTPYLLQKGLINACRLLSF